MNNKRPQQYIHETLDNHGQIFFTSDIHGYHKNLCAGSSSWTDISSCRKFVNESDMTDKVILNINSVVGESDLLFHLGDFAFGHKSNIPLVRNSINCKNIICLYGNHDSNIDEYSYLFNGIYEYLDIMIDKTNYILFHYPIASWNKMSRGSIHLYGHCHGSFVNGGKSMDVGLDPCNLNPVSHEQIISIMDSRQTVAKDHH